VQQDERVVKLNRYGGVLAGLPLLTVIVSYPPTVTGLDPLLGMGNLFLPLILSVLSLFVAVIGGVLLSRGLVNSRAERRQRLRVRISIPVGVVMIISAYLVVVAGFEPWSSFILGSVVFAVAAGVIDEFVG
jgi:hypothetical protein